MKIAEEVGEGETHALDTAILQALRLSDDRAASGGATRLADIARDITALGSATVLAIIIAGAIAFLLLNRQRRTALFVGVATIGGALLASLLKEFFDRPRPDFAASNVSIYTTSFPSGHAMMSAIVYLTLAALLVRLVNETKLKLYVFGLALSLTVAVGLTRILLGVHWPSDVLAGWAIGAAWAMGCWAAAQIWRIRG